MEGCDRVAASRGAKYCGPECSRKAMCTPRGKHTPDELRHCGECGIELQRRKNESKWRFSTRRFCGLACSALALGRERTAATGTVNSYYGHDQELEEPAAWRIYWADKPTKSAGSLTEAKARAAIGDSRYVEIANIETGQHLMRFRGQWTETKPAGSQSLTLNRLAAL
jgi:hypothetical protein